MPAFSINSMLNQTVAAVAAVANNASQPPRPRPSVLDISNLLCSQESEPTLSPGSSNGNSSVVQSPLSASSSCCQLPSIMDVWPAQQLPMLPPMPSQKPHHPLEPTTAAATANGIWLHHSMSSSVSSVASDVSTLSTNAVTNSNSTASQPIQDSATSTTATTRTLPLKKQARRRHVHESHGSSSSSSSEDDQEEPASSQETALLPPIKAKRRRANAKQLEVLNRVFERTVFPSTQLRAELGRQLGMTPRTVQIWFQNRRQAIRTRERQRLLRIVSDDSSAASLSSTATD